VKILFIGSVAVIATDLEQDLKLFVQTLGLPLAGDDDYYHSEQIAGSKSFGIWPLAHAAQACFGTPDWPAEHPVPQASIEFEVADAGAVGPAAAELAARGFPLLHEARVEPWGQTVARVLSPAGLIIGISYAPALHDT
jgi:catechol 2,3-dioxygenase-like lactoylglutathione lyase family enzyme